MFDATTVARRGALAVVILGLSLPVTACVAAMAWLEPIATPKIVWVTPQEITIDTGETITLTAQLNGVAKADVEIVTNSFGPVIDPASVHQYFDDGRLFITFPYFGSPASPGRNWVEIRVKGYPDWTSGYTYIDIRTVEVSVDPADVTVVHGGSHEFTATVTGAVDRGVTWSTTCGTLSGEGNTITFTAPDASMTCWVTAKSIASPLSNASARVRVVPPAVEVSISPEEITLDAGAVQTFTATVANASNESVRWTVSRGRIQGVANTVNYTAPLEPGVYTVTATSVQDPTRSATATVTVRPIEIALDATEVTLPVGGTFSFTATVTGAADRDVTWQATCGRVVGAGSTVTYEAPAAPGECVVTAASKVAPHVTATARVVVEGAPVPVEVAISPGAVTLDAGATQTFTATVTGTGETGVTWQASGGTITGSGSTVTYTAPVQAGSYTVTATSVADPTKSATATVTVNPIQISLNETAVTLQPGQTFAFTATVTGAANPGVTWSATCGSVSPASGATTTFTAPGAEGTCTVTATSVLAPDVSASATVSIQAVPEVQVSISPSAVTLNAGGTQSFTAIVTGTGNTAVTWQATGGTIDGAGNTITYTAPVQAGSYTVTATSVADPTKSATATVVVVAPPDTPQTGDLVVNVATDEDDGVCGVAHCTLREALSAALAVAGSGARTIGFDMALLDATITLGSALPEITADVTIAGISALALTIDAGGARRIFTIAGGAEVTISGLKLTGGQASGPQGGGAVLVQGAGTRVTLRQLAIENNQATSGNGGGVLVTDGARATLEGVRLSGNLAANGGGLAVTGGATAEIASTTVGGNQATGVGGGIYVVGSEVDINGSPLQFGQAARGAGLAVDGGRVSVVSSTFTSNNASVGGGAIYTAGVGSDVALTNVSIVLNQAPEGSGKGLRPEGGTIRLVNTLLALNSEASPGNCALAGGTIVSEGHNLSDDGTCAMVLTASGDMNGVDAGVSPTSGGWSVPVHMLQPGSPAIDVGDPTRCPATDQLEQGRVGTCDIGAVEFVPIGASVGSGSRAPLAFLLRGAAVARETLRY